MELTLDIFIQYLTSEKRFSQHTITAYRSDLEQFNGYLSANYNSYNPREVTHSMVRSWIMALLDENLDAKSVSRKISSLRTYFRYLRRENFIAKNPMIKVSPPKIKSTLPEYINEEQMDYLLDVSLFNKDFNGIRDRLIIEIFYLTGIRLSELVNLTNKSLDLRKNHLKVMGKRNKERIVPFGNMLAESIQTYLSERNSKFGIQGDSDPFFLTEKGMKIYHKLVYRIVNSYLSSVSTLKKRSPHTLRHTFATQMLNRGADLNAIKEILGHANLSATQIYTHNSIEKLKSIYNQAHPKA